MTLSRLLESKNYPRMKELVDELLITIRDTGKATTAQVEAKELLDEVRHLVVAAFNPKEFPR